MTQPAPHYLEGKWFHTLINSFIQQQGKILKVLDHNVAVCEIIATTTFKPTATVLIDLGDYVTPQKWIQFYDSEEKMKQEFELFTKKD